MRWFYSLVCVGCLSCATSGSLPHGGQHEPLKPGAYRAHIGLDMPQAPLTEAQMQEALDLVRLHGSVTEAAEASGFKRATLQDRYSKAKAWATEQGVHVPSATGRMVTPSPKPFEIDALPEELPTADELLQRRRKQFARKSAAKEARALISVRVKIDGPFGVMHMGDPHVDDDGTDIALLESHVGVCNRTEGLFAGNVGDFSNNWVGRLARLYGEQSVSAREAWVLVEWLIGAVNWMYLIGGNHDLWSGAGDPIQWMSRQANSLYEHHGARLGLQMPDGRTIRVNARHDFKGHSQYNTAHGPAKAALHGWRDHILTCGHTHVSGYQVIKDPSSGLISHALRVASYKTHDRYADEKGLPNQNIFVAPVTIIDPRFGDDDPRLVTTIFDPETGADFLTFLRKKWAKGGKAA